jgi:integrase/recombinase XerC
MDQASPHVKKARVWTLRQFFHFLKLTKQIQSNITQNLPYPKIDKKEPLFLTIDEFKMILMYSLKQANSTTGLRNFIIIMLLGFLGLRISALIQLDTTKTQYCISSK